jgi:hypothetical protein
MIRQPDFSGVWIKVERAKEHISDLQALVERFDHAEPYRVLSYCELDTGDLVYEVKVSDQPPLRWSAIVGDAIHNLRSSLDLMVCETVRAKGNTVKKATGFPVFKSARACVDEFKSGAPGQVQGAPKKVVDFIKKSKPYKGANNPLWRIHQLDIADKHKLLVPVGMAHQGTINSYTMADVLEAYPGVTTFKLHELPTAQGIGIVVPELTFPLEDGAEIYRAPARLRTDPVAQMHMDPQFTFGIAFGEGEIVEGEPLVPTLHEFTQFIEGFIESFVVLFSQESP